MVLLTPLYKDILWFGVFFRLTCKSDLTINVNIENVENSSKLCSFAFDQAIVFFNDNG